MEEHFSGVNDLRVARLEIKNFRGIKSGVVYLDSHTALIGTNNSGKSTIIDALAMVLGRDRMVRKLTEHDFYGSSPTHEQRIIIKALIVEFEQNDPNFNSDWFRDGRAVPKWWDPESQEISMEKTKDSNLLAAEIAFSARFDYETLSVESLRFFYDSDVEDPFMLDTIVRFPNHLLTELGFFLVPISRTWDKLVSFSSELFRRLVASSGGIPSNQLLQERDLLRSPSSPLESVGSLGQMVRNVNRELSRLFARAPEIALRITATDSESLLSSIIPHYQFGDEVPLPAGRAGTGLLSLQALLLLLEFGRMRAQEDNNFILSLEEPELHLPPGIQKRLIYRTHSVANQTVISSHSPDLVSFYPATSIRLLVNNEGALKALPLLDKPLQNDAVNGVRKLFRDNRQELIAALMQEYIIVPEGRIDYEWLRLLVRCTETKESWDLCDTEIPFGTLFGVVPTHDASIKNTLYEVLRIRSEVVILVDGDSDGDRYVEEILQEEPYPRLIVQWPKDWVVEDVVMSILGTDEDIIDETSSILNCEPTAHAVVNTLKSERKAGGVKGNYLLYEDLANLISCNTKCLQRAKQLLNQFVSLVLDLEGSHIQFSKDGRSTDACSVWVWNI